MSAAASRPGRLAVECCMAERTSSMCLDAPDPWSRSQSREESTGGFRSAYLLPGRKGPFPTDRGGQSFNAGWLTTDRTTNRRKSRCPSRCGAPGREPVQTRFRVRQVPARLGVHKPAGELHGGAALPVRVVVDRLERGSRRTVEVIDRCPLKAALGSFKDDVDDAREDLDLLDVDILSDGPVVRRVSVIEGAPEVVLVGPVAVAVGGGGLSPLVGDGGFGRGLIPRRRCPSCCPPR